MSHPGLPAPQWGWLHMPLSVHSAPQASCSGSRRAHCLAVPLHHRVYHTRFGSCPQDCFVVSQELLGMMGRPTEAGNRHAPACRRARS
jgi:hypothetical protein